jgi:hypothetical protein
MAAPARSTAGARLLGLLSIVFGGLLIFLDLLNGILSLANGSSLATGLPASFQAPIFDALRPQLESALAAPLAFQRILFLVMSAILIAVGVAVRRGLPWARRAVIAWAIAAYLALAARVAITFVVVARIREVIKDLPESSLPASVSPASHWSAMAIALVLLAGFPLVLVLLAKPPKTT